MSHKRTGAKSRGRAKVLSEKKEAMKRTRVIAALNAQTTQIQHAFLNVRTMYDQKVMEVASLKQQIAVKDQLLTALVVDAPLVVEQRCLSVVASGQFVGYDLDLDEETQDVTITVLASEVNSEVEEAKDEVQMTHFDPVDEELLDDDTGD